MDEQIPNFEAVAAQPKDPSLFPILAVNFIGTLGYSIILPFLVFLVTRLGGNALIYGIVGATYPAFQLVGAPLLGKWSDRYGRRKILLFSQMGTLVSWFIFLLALFLPMSSAWKINSAVFGTFSISLPIIVLFFARALDGITGGNVSVANAYLADITDEEHRNENFGKMAISANLGFVLGPALAGLLGATVPGETLPVLAALTISFIATLMIAFNLPESHPCFLNRDPETVNVRKVFGQEHKECFELKGGEKITLRGIFQLNNIPYLMTLYFLIFLGFNLFYTAFPFHAVKSLKWSIIDTGTFFSVLSLMMVIVQGSVLSRVAKKCSDGFLIVVGSLILGTNFVLLTSRDNLIIYLAAGLFALGNGLMWPSVLATLSKTAGERLQGSVQGFASSFGGVASILGLTMGGILYEWLGPGIFIVSAGIIYMVFLMALSLFYIRKEVPAVEGP